MRFLGLLNRAAAAGWPAGSLPALGSTCLAEAGAAACPRQLTSLLGFRCQQQAGYAASRRTDEDEDDAEGTVAAAAAAAAGGARHVAHSKRRSMALRALEREQEGGEEGSEDTVMRRRRQIDRLLHGLGRGGSADNATQFVSRCVLDRRDEGGSASWKQLAMDLDVFWMPMHPTCLPSHPPTHLPLPPFVHAVSSLAKRAAAAPPPARLQQRRVGAVWVTPQH